MPAEAALAAVPIAHTVVHTPGHNVEVVADMRGSVALGAFECPNPAVVIASS